MIIVGPWVFYLEPISAVVEGDGMADNYLEFNRYVESLVTAPGSIDTIGYNRGDKILTLVHNATIAQNGIQSMHLADDTTAYQNLTGEIAYAIVSVETTAALSNTSYKLYSAPTTDSVADAIEVFDSTDIFSDWDVANTFMTSVLVSIQNNHFIVLENTSTNAAPIRVRTPAADHSLLGVVIEPTTI